MGGPKTSWWYVTPRLDRSKVGVTVASVLFGLVLTDGVLFLGRNLGDMTWTSWSQWLLAVVITVLSYVGYYNSREYPNWRLGFYNLPFFQMVLDLLIIGSYWWLFQTIDLDTCGTGG
ncbi:hypothetical protein B7486_52485, partial [cyanobacterium TDX16]